MAAGAETFSLREVLVAFTACVSEQREVRVDPYLAGWKGLVRCSDQNRDHRELP
ncbi:filaggrin-2 [Platysternon megacephalum]|uniref:Filaggrin-2 n=1 Tax=Platysternon megacephalum TaxID=55544 RepID=A0A4D9DKF5_9SAUR|nr:filaggrin-2 [Platysternon megacephalum]